MDWQTLIGLDKELLLAFNGSSSLFFDGLVKVLTTAATWVPLYISLLYLVIKNNDQGRKVLVIIACALLCVVLAGSLNDMYVKPNVARWRPTRDEDIGVMVDLVNGYRCGRYGFFSSHASNTFSIAVFFCLLVRSRLLSVAMIIWSMVNCWTRLYLGVHFPGDVLCGLLWGGFVGSAMWWICNKLLMRLSTKSGYVSTHYTASGYRFVDIDVVACVLVFTLIYAILRACCFIYV